MNKLNNEELVSLIEYKLKDTLCNLMYDILESPVDEIFNPPDMLNQFENEIRQLYTEIYDCIEKDIKERADFRKRLNTLEDKITDKAVLINKCICINNSLGDRILRNIKLDEVSNVADDIPASSEDMADVIEHFLAHFDDDADMEAMYTKAALMAALPLRMTSAKYRDYVKAGFGKIANNLPDEFIFSSVERLKDICVADNEAMAEDFPLMKQSTDEMYKFNLSELDSEAAEEYLGIIDDNISLLHDIYECLAVIYDDMIYLKLLTDFVYDNDFLFEDDFVLKDLYYSVRNYITDNDDLLVDTIKESLSNEIDERYEKSKTLEAKVSKEISKLRDFDALNDDERISVEINNAISSAYLYDLDQRIMFLGNNTKTTDELGDELCEHIESETSQMSVADKKLMKQKFLGHIPCLLSDFELVEYAKYALDGVRDRQKFLVSCADIFEITDEAEEEHHHEHHHHHDEDCNCGHHH